MAPMWLMVLHNTLYTALVSTTVFVAVFGLVMALWLDKLMDVMSATAGVCGCAGCFCGVDDAVDAVIAVESVSSSTWDRHRTEGI